MSKKIWVGTATAGDWSVAGNWSPSGVPQSNDDVYLENSAQDVSAGLNQSAIILNSLNIDKSFTGAVGTAAAYLQISADIVNIGYNYGLNPQSLLGSGRIKLNLGDEPAAITIFDSALTPTDANKWPVQILCNDAATTLEIRKGKAAIAGNTGETSVLATITLNWVTQKSSDAELFIGEGVTLVTLNQSGGKGILACAATTVTSYGGTLLTAGTGAITTLIVDGSQVTSNSSGTITTCRVNSGLADFTKSAAARTVTNMYVNPVAGQLLYDPASLTLTNGIKSEKPARIMANPA